MKKRPQFQHIVGYFLGCEVKSAKIVGTKELSFDEQVAVYELINRLHSSPLELRVALAELDDPKPDKYADWTQIVFVRCESKAGILLAFTPFELWDNEYILGVWPVASDLFSSAELASTYEFSGYDPALYYFNPLDAELTARVNQRKGWFSRLLGR